jgi:uncharacterized protein YqeY
MTETKRENTLAARVEGDLIRALKGRDQTTLQTLRLLKAAAKNAEIAKRSPLSEDEYSDTIRHQVKMRRDAATEYEKAGHGDRAEQERAELAVLQAYLPAQVDTEAVREVVRSVIHETGATGPGDLGKVMSGSMRVLKGKADGAIVNAMAREMLSGSTG